MTAQRFCRRGLLVGRLGRARACIGGNGASSGQQRADSWQPFDRGPERPVVTRHLHRAAACHELIEPRLPVVSRSHHDEAEQQVVQLVPVARVRLNLLGDALDSRRVQPAQLVRLNGQAAAQRNRTAASLL